MQIRLAETDLLCGIKVEKNPLTKNNNYSTG
jgi:hypothetical protein